MLLNEFWLICKLGLDLQTPVSSRRHKGFFWIWEEMYFKTWFGNIGTAIRKGPFSEFLHEVRRKKLLNLLLRQEGELTGEPPLSPSHLQLTAEIPFPFLVNNKYQRGQSHSHPDPWLYSHCLMSRRRHAQSMHEGLDSAEPIQAQRWLLPTLLGCLQSSCIGCRYLVECSLCRKQLEHDRILSGY